MSTRDARHPEAFSGFCAALAAFIAWGLLPVYWKSVQTAAPLEILCHRIVWSLAFLLVVVTWKKAWGGLFAPLASGRNLLILTVSSLTIGGNWLLYIWAVNTGHVLETSLGYFITPLVNVSFGFIFFRERLNRAQLAAIGLACIGVANAVFSYGVFPWISLTLALSFAFYGLLRKVAAVESVQGLLLETLVLAPLALGYLLVLNSGEKGAFMAGEPVIDLLLIGAGAATALPLIGFAFGARRLQLSTLGVLQFIAPSIAFLLGVFLYQEPFGAVQLVTFACIWAGLAVYSMDTIRTIRRLRREARPATQPPRGQVRTDDQPK